MNYHEIIIGIIEVFTTAINEKTNWGRNQAAELLRDVLDSFPIHQPANLVHSFLSTLEDKTSWGKNQVTIKFYHTIVEALIQELLAATTQDESKVGNLDPDVVKLTQAVRYAPEVPEPGHGQAPVRNYDTPGQMVVAAARKGWLRAKGDKAKACTKCKTNHAICQFTDGKRTISKCYVCG